MKTNTDFLASYVAMAPLALAFERTMECGILSTMPFRRPAIDIGCGEGLFAKVLFAEKIDTGLDPNGRELQRARQLGAYEKLIQCTGDRIPEPDGTYQTVLSNSVLEHIPNLEPVLREAFRLLAPSGVLYITVPTDRFEEYAAVSQVLALLRLHRMQKRFRAFYNRFWAHHHCHAPKDWERVLEAVGFEVFEVRPYAPRYICLVDDLLIPLSAAGLALKKILNRWTLIPAIRAILLAPLISVMRGVLNRAERCPDGGLVFLAARKP